MLLRKTDAKWVPVSLLGYASEKDLQQLLKDAPELIPGCEGTAAVRELWIQGVGSVDVVCVDEAGTLTLVECKLAKNAEIRRAVVGQIFAYASGLERTSYTEFESAFANRAGKPMLNAVQEVASQEVDGKALRTALTAALDEGRFRLVIAVDQITDELRAIVEYLNRHLSDDVALIALELGRLVLQEPAEILVPATYGAEIAAEKEQKGGGTTRWSPEAVKEAAAAIDDEAQRSLVLRLLAHATDLGALIKGGTGLSPSAGFYYSVGTKRPSVWSLFAKPDGPVVVINLASVSGASDPTARQALASLRTSPSLDARLPQDDDEAIMRYPSFPLDEVLSDSSAAEALLQAIFAAVAPAVQPAASASPNPQIINDDADSG